MKGNRVVICDGLAPRDSVLLIDSKQVMTKGKANGKACYALKIKLGNG